MPLCNGWGCRTFHTASRIHVIQIWGVWSHSTVVNEHMAAHSLHYNHIHFPRFGRVSRKSMCASVQNMPLHNGWGCRTFQTASHIHVIQIWGVWAPSTVVYRHMAAHSLRYHHRGFPRFGRVSRKSRWCKCANHNYHFAMVEAVEPFKLHITSMSYLYEMFEHLQLLCIDIWMHIHSVTTTDVCGRTESWCRE